MRRKPAWALGSHSPDAGMFRRSLAYWDPLNRKKGSLGSGLVGGQPGARPAPPDVWASCFKKIRGGEVGELEKWNGSHAVERHTRGERQMESLETSLPSGSMAMVARKRLTREVYLPRETMAKSRPGCCQEPCVGLWSYSSQGLC